MTTIAFDGRYLAADKGSWSGAVCGVVNKIYQIRDSESGELGVIAFAGMHSFVGEVINFLTGKIKHEPEYPDSEESNIVVALCVFPASQQIFTLNEKLKKSYFDWGVPYATGLGQEFALGAMAAGAHAVKAVALAGKWTTAAAHGVSFVDLTNPDLTTTSVQFAVADSVLDQII